MSCSTELSLIAPQFDTDANRTSFLDSAEQRTSACFFGTSYCRAVALLAAHEMTLAGRTSGSPGAVSSKREGGKSISYGVKSNSGHYYQTHYGEQLQALINSHVPAISVTGYSFGCTD